MLLIYVNVSIDATLLSRVLEARCQSISNIEIYFCEFAQLKRLIGSVPVTNVEPVP